MVTLVILFGLSMDYQVFLVSRMNEECVHGRRNSVAVRTGQGETARGITAAATIMICVFPTFWFMGQRDVAEFGIGLAVAVALDADFDHGHWRSSSPPPGPANSRIASAS